MGYRIVYGPMPPAVKAKKSGSLRLRILTAVFALLLVLAVRLVWPQGTQTLHRFLMPGEPTVTETAFGSMIGNIRDGEPLPEAFTAFCRQVLESGNAQIH